jgi:PPM family protein phosphatase
VPDLPVHLEKRRVKQGSMTIESSGLTDTGCVRKNNEDSYRCENALGLYLVADGMGGAQAGEHASNLAAGAVVDFVSAAPESADLERAFAHANRVVLEAAQSDGRYEGMGTTLVAAHIRGEELHLASVGDSRAYALKDGASLVALTEDQSWVNEIGRAQLGMDEETLRKHPMRHVLTMAIGVGEPLRVNAYRYALSAGMLIMICSDGLHGVVAEDAMEHVLRSGSALDEKCRKLIQLARENGGPDNITVVLLRPKL